MFATKIATKLGLVIMAGVLSMLLFFCDYFGSICVEQRRPNEAANEREKNAHDAAPNVAARTARPIFA